MVTLKLWTRMTTDQVAESLQIDADEVERNWRFGKRWLNRALAWPKS